MFPLSDDNPSERTPFVTWTLIGACALVYLWEASLGQEGVEAAFYSFGMIPARLFGYQELSPEMVVVTDCKTIFTSMFMHGGLLHLGGNMLFFWIFGDNVEDSLGHARFLGFYLLCGVAAALTQGLLSSDSTVPRSGRVAPYRASLVPTCLCIHMPRSACCSSSASMSPSPTFRQCWR